MATRRHDRPLEIEGHGTVVLFTERGLPGGSGPWTITFDELVGDARVMGPWVLVFDD